ncbi:type II toxin-antitoxin system RelE/ParE family toxin [Tianweitania sp. BSSL-BM11]|uniref:Type II toxin-antitoxin system RelE/ParE family toxin n=1 Tax=Tianweitania aestuarii TaxID=2814886 RepID=A0ABS5RUB2_9HYPH|nr:type II toxin-antitoxin system RelE/ParE family toxin [Tianweitania aestuarii]
MQTVVTTTQFLRKAESLFSQDDLDALVDFLAFNPRAGVEIVGTGGFRKLRYALPGRGKSGGARVIYFFFDEDVPLHLVSCFAKNEKDNISAADVNTLSKISAAIKAEARRRRS